MKINYSIAFYLLLALFISWAIYAFSRAIKSIPTGKKLFTSSASAKPIENYRKWESVPANNTVTPTVQNEMSSGAINGGGQQPITQDAREDLSNLINTTILNSESGKDVAVVVVDEAENILGALSSDIAVIYSKTGNRSTVGLLRNEFTHRPEFQELKSGNSDIIARLDLIKHTDFLALGQLSMSIREGTMVAGTYVCSASLKMKLISAESRTLIKSFTCDAQGNGTTPQQAQEYALNKLVNKYLEGYASI